MLYFGAIHCNSDVDPSALKDQWPTDIFKKVYIYLGGRAWHWIQLGLHSQCRKAPDGVIVCSMYFWHKC